MSNRFVLFLKICLVVFVAQHPRHYGFTHGHITDDCQRSNLIGLSPTAGFSGIRSTEVSLSPTPVMAFPRLLLVSPSPEGHLLSEDSGRSLVWLALSRGVGNVSVISLFNCQISVRIFLFLTYMKFQGVLATFFDRFLENIFEKCRIFEKCILDDDISFEKCIKFHINSIEKCNHIWYNRCNDTRRRI